MLAKGAIGIGIILATFIGPAGITNAQTLLEQSAEVRMQLDLGKCPYQCGGCRCVQRAGRTAG